MTPQKLGQILSTKRKAKGVSTYALEQKGMNRATVRNVEAGISTITSLVEYCNAVGIKITIK